MTRVSVAVVKNLKSAACTDKAEGGLLMAVNNLEREMIIDALKNTRGNISSAASLLDTTVRKVAYKMKYLGIDYRQFR